MALQVVVPIGVQGGFVMVIKVQFLDEQLEVLGGKLYVRRSVIARGFGAPEKSVEDQKRGAIVDQVSLG